MIYFATPSTEIIRDAVAAGLLGTIRTPQSDRASQRIHGTPWVADNGCYTSKNFDEGKWWAWLVANSTDNDDCVFATALDVVGDHAATLERSEPWLPKIRALGYRAAFVAQDGATVGGTPWQDFDVLFIGGTTEFKLGADARILAAHAKTLDMWIHCGRVNTYRRLRYAHELTPYGLGADSADGTMLTYGPNLQLPRLLGWLERLKSEPALLHGEVAS